MFPALRTALPVLSMMLMIAVIGIVGFACAPAAEGATPAAGGVGTPEPNNSATPHATPRPTTDPRAMPTLDLSDKRMEVTVGPELVDCTGVGPMKCMVVDGNYFYDQIDGFRYEEGYTYRLEIERYDAWPGREAPQDTGQYGYRLLNVVSKVRA